MTMNNNHKFQWYTLFHSLQIDVENFSELINVFQNKRKSNRFHPKMTIEQALDVHPHSKKIFEQFGLPRCNKCTVRFEETLQEASEAYDIDLPKWLAALNQLLKAP